ncbi:MAG TPA: tetratricopeptide repeat protein [Chitinophagaceae bacterium]|nr:tetratricopeptide repeat protein [Chitinophagaceae bacterium]
MKNLPALILLSTLLFACNNNHTVSGHETKDSLQQLLQSYRDSIKKYPNDTVLKYGLVLTLQEAGKYKEALGVLDSINLIKSDSANLKIYFDYLFKRSELLTQAGDTANAIKTLEFFVIPGELTEAGLQLANLYAETRNPKTIAICDSMNKNDESKRDPNPDYLKGIYYYNIGDNENALKQFNSCIKKDYTFLDAYMEKGRIFYTQSRFKEAVEVYDMAIKVSNTYADAHLWKGKCEEALGNKEDAKISYQRAYAFDKALTEAKEAADRINN